MPDGITMTIWMPDGITMAIWMPGWHQARSCQCAREILSLVENRAISIDTFWRRCAPSNVSDTGVLIFDGYHSDTCFHTRFLKSIIYPRYIKDASKTYKLKFWCLEDGFHDLIWFIDALILFMHFLNKQLLFR